MVGDKEMSSASRAASAEERKKKTPRRGGGLLNESNIPSSFHWSKVRLRFRVIIMVTLKCLSIPRLAASPVQDEDILPSTGSLSSNGSGCAR